MPSERISMVGREAPSQARPIKSTKRAQDDAVIIDSPKRNPNHCINRFAHVDADQPRRCFDVLNLFLLSSSSSALLSLPLLCSPPVSALPSSCGLVSLLPHAKSTKPNRSSAQDLPNFKPQRVTVLFNERGVCALCVCVGRPSPDLLES